MASTARGIRREPRVARGTLFVAALFWALTIGVGLCAAAASGRRTYKHPRVPYMFGSGASLASHYWNGPEPITLCEERFLSSTLDHFAWDNPKTQTTFQQRYFFCDKYWKTEPEGEKGPIFIYLGNEADVTLYVNATGLMWENAQGYGALLVFIEHRYYGKSVPEGSSSHFKQFLTTEQAIADYAEFIFKLKIYLNATDSPVIGFGGSYGGMIASWMRMKYPHILDGVIAGSAPIWCFLGEEPRYDPYSYDRIVTYDATPAAGSAEACVSNVRNAWATIWEMYNIDKGFVEAKKALRVCESVDIKDKDDVSALIGYLTDAFSTFAMGSYPYSSDYMTNGGGSLPAYPMRVSCNSFLSEPMNGTDLLSGIAKSVGLLYNSTGDLECFDYTSDVNNASAKVDDTWSWQYCSEMFIPFASDGVHDMFFEDPYIEEEAISSCINGVGVLPRPLWATIEWGGKKISSASNIVFSNGEYDPWRGGGVTENFPESVVSIIIPEVGHHVDLFFSHPKDTDAIKAARHIELDSISKWIHEARSRKTKEQQDGTGSFTNENTGQAVVS